MPLQPSWPQALPLPGRLLLPARSLAKGRAAAPSAVAESTPGWLAGRLESGPALPAQGQCCPSHLFLAWLSVGLPEAHRSYLSVP